MEEVVPEKKNIPPMKINYIKKNTEYRRQIRKKKISTIRSIWNFSSH